MLSSPKVPPCVLCRTPQPPPSILTGDEETQVHPYPVKLNVTVIGKSTQIESFNKMIGNHPPARGSERLAEILSEAFTPRRVPPPHENVVVDLPNNPPYVDDFGYDEMRHQYGSEVATDPLPSIRFVPGIHKIRTFGSDHDIAAGYGMTRILPIRPTFNRNPIRSFLQRSGESLIQMWINHVNHQLVFQLQRTPNLVSYPGAINLVILPLDDLPGHYDNDHHGTSSWTAVSINATNNFETFRRMLVHQVAHTLGISSTTTSSPDQWMAVCPPSRTFWCGVYQDRYALAGTLPPVVSPCETYFTSFPNDGVFWYYVLEDWTVSAEQPVTPAAAALLGLSVDRLFFPSIDAIQNPPTRTFETNEEIDINHHHTRRVGIIVRFESHTERMQTEARWNHPYTAVGPAPVATLLVSPQPPSDQLLEIAEGYFRQSQTIWNHHRLPIVIHAAARDDSPFAIHVVLNAWSCSLQRPCVPPIVTVSVDNNLSSYQVVLKLHDEHYDGGRPVFENIHNIMSHSSPATGLTFSPAQHLVACRSTVRLHQQRLLTEVMRVSTAAAAPSTAAALAVADSAGALAVAGVVPTATPTTDVNLAGVELSFQFVMPLGYPTNPSADHVHDAFYHIWKNLAWDLTRHTFGISLLLPENLIDEIVYAIIVLYTRNFYTIDAEYLCSFRQSDNNEIWFTFQFQESRPVTMASLVSVLIPFSPLLGAIPLPQDQMNAVYTVFSFLMVLSQAHRLLREYPSVLVDPSTLPSNKLVSYLPTRSVVGSEGGEFPVALIVLPRPVVTTGSTVWTTSIGMGPCLPHSTLGRQCLLAVGRWDLIRGLAAGPANRPELRTTFETDVMAAVVSAFPSLSVQSIPLGVSEYLPGDSTALSNGLRDLPGVPNAILRIRPLGSRNKPIHHRFWLWAQSRTPVRSKLLLLVIVCFILLGIGLVLLMWKSSPPAPPPPLSPPQPPPPLAPPTSSSVPFSLSSQNRPMVNLGSPVNVVENSE